MDTLIPPRIVLKVSIDRSTVLDVCVQFLFDQTRFRRMVQLQQLLLEN